MKQCILLLAGKRSLVDFGWRTSGIRFQLIVVLGFRVEFRNFETGNAFEVISNAVAKIFTGDDGWRHWRKNVPNDDLMQSSDQYHTATTHIPFTINTLATSSVQPTELPIMDRSLDCFALKSFQYPDSMPVYLKGRCLRHCSTSNSNDFSDHYPFQVSVSIHGRDFRKVLDVENIFGLILKQNF